MSNGYTPRIRPKILQGYTYKIETGCGSMFVTITHDDHGMFEVFASMGKNGQCGMAQIEAICRCVSAGLRSGVSSSVFIKQLLGVRCLNPTHDEGQDILSCSDAIAKIMELDMKENSSKEIE